ncbi:HD domain-containing protein [Aeromonas veronii]|uniref:HD domain-containing protein n=1 Tax=Aeromonas TaxID=642 RepID=UPI0022DFFDFB|nr:HD domain-containing protein [Aeromonas sp. QDB59]
MRQLCWLTNLDRSAHLPITVCELRYGAEPVQALLTADLACRFPAEQGLVDIHIEPNRQGHLIVGMLDLVPQVISYELYACAMRTLTKEHLPLLTRFVSLLGLVNTPCLQRFVDYWSDHPEHFAAYLSMPASYRDHHAYPHGLFIHSLEVAELAYSNAVRLQHSPRECQLALLAGLFHDLGKIYSQTEADVSGYQTGVHECLNFSLLALELDALAKDDWDCHRIFTSMLAPYSRHRSEQYAIEGIFRNADHNSCQSDRSRMLFADKPPYYRFIKDGQRMVRRLPG